jgi:hypothetical protein
VAFIYSGIVSTWSGPIGPAVFRRNKRGEQIVVPRRKRKPASPKQLAWQRYFATTARLGGLLFLPCGKPFYKRHRPYYSAFTMFLKHTLLGGYGPNNTPVPYPFVGDLPGFNASVLSVNMFARTVTIAPVPEWQPWLLPSDNLIAVLWQPDPPCLVYTPTGYTVSSDPYIFDCVPHYDQVYQTYTRLVCRAQPDGSYIYSAHSASYGDGYRISRTGGPA